MEPLITDISGEFQFCPLYKVFVIWDWSSNEYYDQPYLTVVGMSIIKLHIGMIKKVLLNDYASHCQHYLHVYIQVLHISSMFKNYVFALYYFDRSIVFHIHTSPPIDVVSL